MWLEYHLIISPLPGNYGGNPLYNWKLHQESNFAWWVARLRSILELVDMVRLDHFRGGFAAAWHVPFGNDTAIQGEWIPGPAVELFTEFKRNFEDLPIIAEDLGVITPDVESLRDDFGMPGMKVLQFAFPAIRKTISCRTIIRNIVSLTLVRMTITQLRDGMTTQLTLNNNFAVIILILLIRIRQHGR